MIRNIFLACLACLLLTTAAAFAKTDAADFELKDTKGKKATLEDLLDGCNLLLIDFWQVGCKPCNELLPHLQDYLDEYGEKGLDVVIISRDTALTLSQVEPFFTSNKYTFRILLDTDLEVSKDYGVKASPATFIIAPDKTMLYRHFNYKSGQEKEIEQFIKDYFAGKEVQADLESEQK
jgi:peroxiredoxin